MYVNKEMYEACKHVWRTGMRREAGMAYVTQAMGFSVPEWQYVEAFRMMFINECNLIRAHRQ